MIGEIHSTDVIATMVSQQQQRSSARSNGQDSASSRSRPTMTTTTTTGLGIDLGPVVAVDTAPAPAASRSRLSPPVAGNMPDGAASSSIFLQPPTPERDDDAAQPILDGAASSLIERRRASAPSNALGLDAGPSASSIAASSSLARPTTAAAAAAISSRNSEEKLLRIQSASLLNIARANQTLPEVRSPPKKPRNDLFPEHHQAEDAATAAKIEEVRSGRRPRVFGFTEIPGTSSSRSTPDGGGASASHHYHVSSTTSSPATSSSSRDTSPDRYGGLEMIPRKKQHTQAFAFFAGDDNKPKEGENSAAGTSSEPLAPLKSALKPPAPVIPIKIEPAPPIPFLTSSSAWTSPPIPGQSASTDLARRPSLDRLPSGAARIHRSGLLRLGGPPKPTLSERLASQRGESSALKLDLNGIRSGEGGSSSSLAAGGAAGAAPTSTPPPSTLSPIIRKKSGELLKPSLKSSSSYTDVTTTAASASGRGGLHADAGRSVPSTPSLKFVHFDPKLEKIKLFRNDQKPEVVSRDGTPNDYDTSENEYPFPSTDEEGVVDGKGRYELQIRLLNFPTDGGLARREDNISLEGVFLSDDRKNLRGTIRVKNLSFEKRVVVRYTHDWWQTTNEVTATYKESLHNNFDRFQFNVKLADMMAKIEDKTLFLALRYSVNGTEHWDNNQGSNYQVSFAKQRISTASSLVAKRNGGAIPASMGRAIGSNQWDVKGQEQDRLADLKAKLDRLTAGDVPDGTSPPENSLLTVRGQSPIRRGGGLLGISAGPRSPSAVADGPTSPLASRYSFESAWNADKKRSGSPAGGNKNSTLSFSRPSQDFYSPRLSFMNLQPTDLPSYGGQLTSMTTTSSTGTASDASTPKVSSKAATAPPTDYFVPAAPAATGGVVKPSPKPRAGASLDSMPPRDSPPSVSNSVSSLSSIEDSPISPPNRIEARFAGEDISQPWSNMLKE